ncbi:MAG: response regulator [Desulfuromonadaceae bacterium]|nr:response regulator [Desulfuromonadaceae bacterium]MDD2856645.1 response regulator [Desulfuromonadaceae bacterium]
MSDRPSVLIVDDEAINIQILESALRTDYEIYSALNGFDAISLVKEKMPDLILLDVMMPELSGFDVCKIIKDEVSFAHIPVIFMTALDTIAGEFTGLDIGGIDYMTKPVNFDLLKLRVRNHVELKKRHDLIMEQRDQLMRQNSELEASLARVKQLEGIIPICAYCKKIRNDQESWQNIEQYISEHSGALFSHGACPDCAEEQMEKIRNMK